MSTTTRLPLGGKSTLVTGAARSIGAEIALTLARQLARRQPADCQYARRVTDCVWRL